MKHVLMTRRDDPPPEPVPRPKKRGPDAAFDLWLRRGLHELYDEIANEPLPEALLKLIADDRKKDPAG